MAEINILFIGDVCANIGVNALRFMLPKLQAEYDIAFTVVNAENALDGEGVDEKTASILFAAGADVLTGGNHSLHDFSLRKDFLPIANVLRPANIPEVGGNGAVIVHKGEFDFLVANFLGRENMRPADSPFTAADAVLRKFSETAPSPPITIVDFHAESPEEKEAFAFYLDGRISLVVGTHTHVQTADEKILPNGTGYITDVGFVGLRSSVIGANPEFVLERQQRGFSTKPRWQDSGEAIFCAVIAAIDTETKKTKMIHRILRSVFIP